MRKEEKVWDRFSAVYDKFMVKDEDVYKKMTQKMFESVEENESVLEIATGTGILAFPLAKKLKQITAVDFSEKMIKIARDKSRQMNVNNIIFDVQDACHLNFEDNQFDVVIISNALHIMPNPEKALSEIKRVLKKDGRLIAPTFMHKTSVRARIFSKLSGIVGFKAYHKWDEKAYCNFLRAQGFKNVSSSILKSSFNVAYATAQVEK